ncbi:MAG: tripartite tricarboxylate transporter TctB family protein [Dokdonella sp.]
MKALTPSPDLAGAVGCVLLIAVGGAALFYSSDFSPLGAVFPRTIAGLMIALGVAYLILVWRGRTRVAEPLGGSMSRRAGVALVMLAWALALDRVGFLVSSAIAFVALLLIANHERWSARSVIVYGLVSVAVLGGLYGGFRFALQVPFPTGLFQ